MNSMNMDATKESHEENVPQDLAAQLLRLKRLSLQKAVADLERSVKVGHTTSFGAKQGSGHRLLVPSSKQ